MTAGLPHRAKPPLLHEICRTIKNRGSISKSDAYDMLEENEKTIRRTLEYGVSLGFLEREDDRYSLTGRGSALAYISKFEGQAGVHEMFQDAIRDYEPYRDAVAVGHTNVTNIKDADAVTQDGFREGLEKSVGEDVKDREVNVLIKTAEAAGLGEYVVGRRKYQTRLVVNDEFEAFASELSEDLLPLADEEADVAAGDDAAGEPAPEADVEAGKEVVQKSLSVEAGEEAEDGETVTHLHIHVWADDEDEVASLLRRAGGGAE